ncbi:hypothetical protein BASA81_013763 [Batrachochytrium salamandrivorans]|nr:hypothetical protein BASA81_013763 [Batrachochytrium salamandrivorans]
MLASAVFAVLVLVLVSAQEGEWDRQFDPQTFASHLNLFLSQTGTKIAALSPSNRGAYVRDHQVNTNRIQQVIANLDPAEAQQSTQALITRLVPKYLSLEQLNELHAHSLTKLLPSYFADYVGSPLPSSTSASITQYLGLVLGVKLLQASALNANASSSSTHVVNHLSAFGPNLLRQVKGYTPSKSPTIRATPAPFPAQSVPQSINWVDLGAVGPVLNQGSCGGCWAFAATEVVEGRLVAGNLGSLTSLSVQQLLSCVDGGQDGCNGGSPITAWEYVSIAGGITADSLYPFVNAKDTSAVECSATKSAEGVVTNSFYSVVLQSEQDMLQAVAFGGPIVIAISTPSCFESYGGGVLTQNDCPCYQGPSSVDHAIVVVGFGTTAQGIDYWLAKNSWGPGWGAQGYIMLERNVGGMGMCGLLSEPSYPDQVQYSSACAGGGSSSFCAAAGAGQTYTLVNLTTGQSLGQCVPATGGAYFSPQCHDSHARKATVAGGLILALMLLIY